MSKKKLDLKINLVPKDPFFRTPIGKILDWAVHIGRYIVIFTELVVILSFAARFKLDRDLTDLNDSIHQKTVILESYGDLESRFRLAQAKIDSYQQITQKSDIVEVFPKLQAVVPEDIILEQLTVDRERVTIEATALSNNALQFFINNLQLSPHFVEVIVGTIESREKQLGYNVKISASTNIQEGQ